MTIVPGRGRVASVRELGAYRDMLVAVRARVQQMIAGPAIPFAQAADEEVMPDHSARNPLSEWFALVDGEERTSVTTATHILNLRGNPSVLLVDDDQSVVDVFTRALGSLGIHVVCALDGRRALTLAHRDPFNLLLLETKLPDLHGLDVVRELRADGFNTPFIVVSGSATIQMAVEATKLGAWGVLEKPVRLSELGNMVRAALASTALDCLVTADPHTPCERWCNFMIGLVTAEYDLKTDLPWAKHVGVSLSALRDCCRRVGVKVEDARNFGRALRAICRSGDHWTPETVLDIDDARTLKRFEQRSGVRRGLNGRERNFRAPTLHEFFDKQEWLAHDNCALLALRSLLVGTNDAVTGGEQRMLTYDPVCLSRLPLTTHP